MNKLKFCIALFFLLITSSLMIDFIVTTIETKQPMGYLMIFIAALGVCIAVYLMLLAKGEKK